MRDNDLRPGSSGSPASPRATTSSATARQHACGRALPEDRGQGRPRGRAGRARRGYSRRTRDTAAPVEARDAALQRAVDSPFELADVPLRATTHVFGEAIRAGRVLLTAEADIRGLAFADEGGSPRTRSSHAGGARTARAPSSFRFDQQFEMSFRPETRARYEQTWFPIAREAAARPGRLPGAVIVRDQNAGAWGASPTTSRCRGAGLRLSTPILSDRLREDGPEARVPEPIARRTFAPAGVLHCRFEVYGAARTRTRASPT